MWTSTWKRLQEDSSGERAISIGHQWGQQPKTEVPVPAKVPFSPMPLVLLLVATSWLFLTHCSWEHLQIVDENAAKECASFSICLFMWLRQLALSPCLAGAPIPPFSFFLIVGKPKAHFLGSYWHQRSCMPLSSLTSAKALWNSCLVSSRIYQQKQLGSIAGGLDGLETCLCFRRQLLQITPVLWAARVQVLCHCRNTVVPLLIRRLRMHLSTETGCINFISNHRVCYTNKTQSHQEMHLS